MDIDVAACFNYVQTNAQNLGNAKGEIIRLEAKVKATKAALMDASDSSSIAMKEVFAYGNPQYMAVVQELADATAEEARLGIMIKAAFFKIEVFKTLEYTRRQEIKNLS